MDMTKPYLAPRVVRLAIAGGISIAFGIFALLAIGLNGWKFLRVQPEVVLFHDLRTLTATAGCINANPEWSIQSAPCSSLGTEYNYPSLPARILALFGVDETATYALGMTLLVLMAITWFILVYLVLGSPIQPWRLVILALVIFSPPGFLAVERGNYDIVILFLVVSAASLYISRFRWAASILLAVSVSLKYISLGAFAMLLRDKHQRLASLGPFLVLSAVLMGVSWQEIFFISQRTPTTATQSFGAALLPISVYEIYPWVGDLSGLDRVPSAKVAGIAVFITVAGLLLVALHSSKFAKFTRETQHLWTEMFAGRKASTLFLGGVGSLVGAYLLGTNFNYRLIFMVPIVASLTMLPANFGRIPLIAATTTVYVGTWVPSLLHWISDISLLILMPYLFIGFLSVSALGPPRALFGLQGIHDTKVRSGA